MKEEFPNKYDSKTCEEKYIKYWSENRIYKFDKKDAKRKVYSIDTPPPTVSGKMHLGHAFSYSQMDFIARYKRMNGYNVFYPFGTDDNGLATIILVEKINKVRAKNMARAEFTELCLKTLEEIRPKYLLDIKKIGLSTDFDLKYTTIDAHCRKIAQKSFIDLYNINRIYRKKSPIMICPKCKTAIAQVELEDVERESYLIHIKVPVIGTKQELVFATTRPELLPACIGISVHPKDKRYKNIIGKYVKMPITGAEIEVTPDEETDMNYATGVVYYCSYGGVECIEWMSRHSGVKPINIMGVDGVYNRKAGKYEGMTSLKAREEIINDLEKTGALVKQEAIKHIVNTHERCGTDIEFVATEQWFIKYLDLKEKLLKAGAKLNWNPAYMKNRLDNWIKGLKWDWCLSRQKKFGVPIPLWYCKKCGEVILADQKQLPTDPLENKPLIKKCPRCNCAEFIPEMDVLDTWATSSMTPQIAASLVPDRYDDIYPMDLRPQAHDIISFWLFNTVVKSQLHNKINPWKDVMISGWALDPKGKKMSKSKGNVVEPQIMIEKYSADALRYWAAKSKLGDDLAFKEDDLRNGMRLCIKLWNASRFTIFQLDKYDLEKIKSKDTEIIDAWMIEKTNIAIKKATKHMDNYEYSAAKKEIEMLFYNSFCDNYLEFIKYRIYDEQLTESKKSALMTLDSVLFSILKMFAPFIPFITEEIYQLHFKENKKEKSIHLCSWSKAEPQKNASKCLMAGDLLCDIIAQIRQYKNGNGMSLKTELKQVKISLKTKEEKKLIEQVIKDVKGVGKIENVVLDVDENQEINIFCENE